ncbi:MAG: hypothetical protein IJL89_00680 [Firmicutes bacterium]|nr:hypothetical protein [Bacillota bacterium]
MNVVDDIKSKIQKLFKTNSLIHIDVSMRYPKPDIVNQEAVIKAVYPSIFRIESDGKCYTLQYTDILLKNVRIAELEYK